MKVSADFDITTESLEKNRMIADSMYGKTFHFHTHTYYMILEANWVTEI